MGSGCRAPGVKPLAHNAEFVISQAAAVLRLSCGFRPTPHKIGHISPKSGAHYAQESARMGPAVLLETGESTYISDRRTPSSAGPPERTHGDGRTCPQHNNSGTDGECEFYECKKTRRIHEFLRILKTPANFKNKKIAITKNYRRDGNF